MISYVSLIRHISPCQCIQLSMNIIFIIIYYNHIIERFGFVSVHLTHRLHQDNGWCVKKNNNNKTKYIDLFSLSLSLHSSWFHFIYLNFISIGLHIHYTVLFQFAFTLACQWVFSENKESNNKLSIWSKIKWQHNHSHTQYASKNNENEINKEFIINEFCVYGFRFYKYV